MYYRNGFVYSVQLIVFQYIFLKEFDMYF